MRNSMNDAPNSRRRYQPGLASGFEDIGGFDSNPIYLHRSPSAASPLR